MQRIPWGPIRSSLESFTFSEIKKIVGYTGVEMSKLSHLEQKSGSKGATKSQLLSAIDQQLGLMDDEEIGPIASICCEEMLKVRPNLLGELERVLTRVGWQFSGQTLLPIEIFDLTELSELPDAARVDLKKAATRLRDGDFSGALSTSCGAVESVTSVIYQEAGLTDHDGASFQEKVKKSLEAVKAETNLMNELQSIGWNSSDSNMTVKNLSGSFNQAALVMQKLRSNMGDVHGTKPVISAIAFDSIKWASLIIRILGTKN